MYVLQIDLGRETFIWCGAKAQNIFWVVVEKGSEQVVSRIRSLPKGDEMCQGERGTCLQKAVNAEFGTGGYQKSRKVKIFDEFLCP
jgi:hypothetical protein